MAWHKNCLKKKSISSPQESIGSPQESKTSPQESMSSPQESIYGFLGTAHGFLKAVFNLLNKIDWFMNCIENGWLHFILYQTYGGSRLSLGLPTSRYCTEIWRPRFWLLNWLLIEITAKQQVRIRSEPKSNRQKKFIKNLSHIRMTRINYSMANFYLTSTLKPHYNTDLGVHCKITVKTVYLVF